MATKAKSRKKTTDILDQPIAKSDMAKFVEQVRENPVLYGAAAIFVLLCVLAGLFYQASSAARVRDATTTMARAVDEEKPDIRSAEYEKAAARNKHLAADALYLAAEAAYEAKDYPRAKQLFEQVRAQYPDSHHVPDAIEGLAYIAENEQQSDQAIALYREILEKWPNSMAARRQHMNLARAYESAGNLEEAVKEYQAQIDQYPGSVWESEANVKLEDLKAKHPELFIKPAEPAPAETPAAETTTPAPEGQPDAAVPAEVPLPSETPAAQ